jgi:DNA-directed RNA polymerase specialized sigma24 family protein
VLLRLVRALPTFEYDPARGGFRSWLKTVVIHEVSNLGRALQRRAPGDRGTGDSDVADRLAEHPEVADDLIDGVGERSEQLMACVRDARAQLEAECQAKNSPAFEAFRLTCLEGLSVKEAQKRLGYESYFALTQAAHRIKKRLKAQAWQLARERGLIAPDTH